MGIMIYASEEGTVDGELTKTKISALKEIKDGWDRPAFNFSKNGSGFEISESPMEGCDPYNQLPPPTTSEGVCLKHRTSPVD